MAASMLAQSLDDMEVAHVQERLMNIAPTAAVVSANSNDRVFVPGAWNRQRAGDRQNAGR